MRGTAVAAKSLLLVFIVLAAARPGLAETLQAPFGDKVGLAVVNYDRASPNVATAGLLKAGAIGELRALGFKTVIDLRGPEEGIAEERAAVGAAGLTYINIPVTAKAPAPDQIAPFAAAIENPANWPVLVHCVSANRVGAMWALYRAARGVPPEVAIEEGRAQGLKPSREAAVRRQLGLAPLQN
jgi:uncharacterized protein (TIGR01244 family)